jgi:hypothetical protein
MPLIIIVGNMGHGKTLYLTYECIKYRQKGYHIYTNYKLNSKLINYTLLERPKDLLKVDPDELNFVALDEVYLWFDSYEGSNKARQLQRNLINVSRKMNMVIYATTQTKGQINLRYRLLLNFVMRPWYYSRKDILLVKKYWVITDEHRGSKDERKVITTLIKNASRIFKYYQTGEVLQDFKEQKSILED